MWIHVNISAFSSPGTAKMLCSARQRGTSKRWVEQMHMWRSKESRHLPLRLSASLPQGRVSHWHVASERSVSSCLRSPALRHTQPCCLFTSGSQAFRANTHTQRALSLVARGIILMKYFKYQIYQGGSQFRMAISTEHTRPPWNVRCQNDRFPLQCFLALGYESICSARFWTQRCSLHNSTSSHPGPAGGWDRLGKPCSIWLRQYTRSFRN